MSGVDCSYAERNRSCLSANVCVCGTCLTPRRAMRCRQGMVIAVLAKLGVVHETLTYTQDEVAGGLNVRWRRLSRWL